MGLSKLWSGKYGGLFQMILGTLGLVLFTTVFGTILTYFVTLAENSALANFLVMDILVKIGPTLLFLGGLFSLIYFGQVKGFQRASGAGIGSLVMVVYGAIEVILFLAMFNVILNNFEALRTSDNLSYFIALSVCISIGPAMAFLAGLFSGVGTFVSGVKGMGGKKGQAAA
jgi:hypothetical protein